jgi:hypothetical protein
MALSHDDFIASLPEMIERRNKHIDSVVSAYEENIDMALRELDFNTISASQVSVKLTLLDLRAGVVLFDITKELKRRYIDAGWQELQTAELPGYLRVTLFAHRNVDSLLRT